VRQRAGIGAEERYQLDVLPRPPRLPDLSALWMGSEV